MGSGWASCHLNQELPCIESVRLIAISNRITISISQFSGGKK